MVHQTEIEPRRVGLAHGPLHFHRHGGCVARGGRAQAQAGGVAGGRSLGQHQRRGCEGFIGSDPHIPETVLTADHPCFALAAQLAAGLACLVSQVGIEPAAAHDPERGVPGKLCGHRIPQRPGEADAADHLVHRRSQIEGE